MNRCRNQFSVFVIVGGVLSVCLLIASTARSAVFTNTEPLNTFRYLHTATLLTNGKVLVTGGICLNEQNSSGVTNGVELFDPVLNTWTLASSMNAKLFWHTATRLSDGKVMVVGGTVPELYSPNTDTWAFVIPLATGRFRHTATLLPDGRLLVAGGGTTEAEIYLSGAWTNAGTMSSVRYDARATLLPNGRVLVTGGINELDQILSTVETFDPSAGTWTTNRPIITKLTGHTATLLPSGEVLVAGGRNGLSQSVKFAALYNPATDTWRNTGFLRRERINHTATLLSNGKVLVVGGVPDARAEIYDPGTETWAFVGTLTTNRFWHTATSLQDGRVLFAAGQWMASSALNTSEVNDSSNIVVAPFNLKGPVVLPGGAVQFSFTNAPDISFVALGTPNLSSPAHNWTALNKITEVSSGHYEFVDTSATNSPHRYYQIRSP